MSSELFVKRRDDLEIPSVEAMWLEIRSKNNKFSLSVIYRPPHESVEFWEHMQTMLDSARETRILNIFLIGDFNADNGTFNGNDLDFLLQANSLTCDGADVNGLHLSLSDIDWNRECDQFADIN